MKLYSHEYDDTVKLDVVCIDKCNYNCEYCFNLKGGHVRTNEELDFRKLYSFMQWLYKKTGKHIIVSLIGGEPTLHSQFEYFSKLVYNSGFASIISFSNFSKPYSFFRSIALDGVKYLLTFHYHDQCRTEDFVSKLQKLADEGLVDSVDTVNVMLLKNKFDECLSIYDTLFAKYGNKIRCNLIDDCDKDNQIQLRQQNYSRQHLSQYDLRCKQSNLDRDIIAVYNDGTQAKFNDYDIKNNSSVNFKYWKCNAGKDYFNISLDGSIYPCNGMATKKLGTLDSYQHIQFKPTLCMTSQCPCEYGLEKTRLMQFSFRLQK